MLKQKSDQYGFVRDSLEKASRLAEILSFIGDEPFLKDRLALKGGAAINLAVSNLSRLLTDIDLDFSRDSGKREMQAERYIISETLKEYMLDSGYTLVPSKLRSHYALDSFVFSYTGSGGAKDNLKIEINYILRSHVLPINKATVKLPWDSTPFHVLCVDSAEIFGSKTAALLGRAAVRDLYDMYTLQKTALAAKPDWRECMCKCAVFYSALSGLSCEDLIGESAFSRIDTITHLRVKKELCPIIKRSEYFDPEEAKQAVKTFLTGVLDLSPEEKLFLNNFVHGEYSPELLFSSQDTADCLERVMAHPMALWKSKRAVNTNDVPVHRENEENKREGYSEAHGSGTNGNDVDDKDNNTPDYNNYDDNNDLPDLRQKD